MSSFFPGFFISISLILAIGAQNAFLLKHGLRREHVLPIVLVCAVSDAILIIVGVAGFGSLAHAFPWFETLMRYGGAAFLFWYGLQNALSAWRGGMAMNTDNQVSKSLKSTLLTLLAITWLNPHVYLDTVVLIGSLSSQYDNRVAFGAGAAFGSFVFFFALGYGARLLSPIFAKPTAWRILDGFIAVTMWVIAISLLI